MAHQNVEFGTPQYLEGSCIHNQRQEELILLSLSNGSAHLKTLLEERGKRRRQSETDLNVKACSRGMKGDSS